VLTAAAIVCALRRGDMGRDFIAIGRRSAYRTLALLAIGFLHLAGAYLKYNEDNNAEAYEEYQWNHIGSSKRSVAAILIP
jgi:hypothetical protein